MSGSRNQIVVRITGNTDQASAAINQVAARLERLHAPSERLQKSFARLGDASGITTLGREMGNFAAQTFSAFENVSRLGGPLSAIASAGTLAGMARLSTAWANYGSQLGFSAVRAGVTAGTLSDLQNAARLAGSSAEAMTAGLTGLKDNLLNINAGRAAPMTISAFNQLGIATRDQLTGRIRSANEVLPELAEKIRAVRDPTMQAMYATLTFGGAGEALLPVLRLGARGLEEYRREAVEYGAMNEAGARAANELREKQMELTLATEGLGFAIAEKLAPEFGPLLDGLSKWISDNRGLIAQDVSGWGDDYLKVLKTVGGGIDEVVRSTIGWNRALEIGLPLALSQAIGPVRRLEKALAGLVALRIPTWLGLMLGIPAEGALAGGAAFLAGTVGAGALGGAMNMPFVDDQGNVVAFPGKEPEAPTGPPTGNPIWNALSRWWRGGGAPPGGDAGAKQIAPLKPDIEAEVRRQAVLHRLDPEHMVRLAQVEHGGYINVSPAGAIGTMQLMPGTARDLGVDPTNWRENIRGGMDLYARHLRRFGSYPAADAAYNAGPAGRGVDLFARTGISALLPDETQAYVRSINPDVHVQASAAAPPAQTLKGNATLNVNLRGAPAGTQVTSLIEGNVFNPGAIRVEQLMPGTGP